jgi:ribonuclease BN (tRNA processing enzyme)
VEITLLGSGGFIPTGRRETASALIREGSEALLIDAGSGARRLVTDDELLSGVERLHVILTHFHLDHMLGLFYIPAIDGDVEIWGAGEVLEQMTTQSLVRRLLDSPFAPSSFVDSFAAIHELDGAPARVGRWQLRTRIQRLHANPTLALRLDDSVVWCTDTAYDDANADFARGARILFHEAFHAADDTDDQGHTAAGEAARLAAAAGVDQLVLIHVNPLLDDDAALLRHAVARFGATVVARDGLQLTCT